MALAPRHPLALRAGGPLLLLALLGAYALEHGRENLAELLWACHVCTALLGLGLLLGLWRLVAAAALFYVTVGVPAWLLEVVASGTTTASSLALHLATPLVGGLALRGRPPPRGTVALAFALYPAVLLLSRMLTDPARNINVAHAVWPAMSPYFPSLGLYWVFNGVLVLGSLLAGERAWARLHGRPWSGAGAA